MAHPSEVDFAMELPSDLPAHVRDHLELVRRAQGMAAAEAHLSAWQTTLEAETWYLSRALQQAGLAFLRAVAEHPWRFLATILAGVALGTVVLTLLGAGR